MEQLVLEHGTIMGIKAYADILDKMLGAAKKSVEVARARGEVIEREFFKAHVKNYLDVLSQQLFDLAGDDEKLSRDFNKIIQHTKRHIDGELGKNQRIKEVRVGVRSADA